MDRPKEMAKVADNATGLNNQYTDRPFGLPGDYASSGASGTAGVTAAATAGSLVGSPAVSVPFASSQVPGNMPRVSVYGGDTSGFSDDLAAHASAVVAAPQDALLSTGAGDGAAGHFRHPNAGAGQGGA
jgi:hypothetical protein